jgi:putative ribosome biogenesis GTPase RsgA
MPTKKRDLADAIDHCTGVTVHVAQVDLSTVHSTVHPMAAVTKLKVVLLGDSAVGKSSIGKLGVIWWRLEGFTEQHAV